MLPSATRSTAPSPALAASSDHTASAIVFVPWWRRMPCGSTNDVLRTDVVDVLPDVPAVDEDQHAIVARGSSAKRRPTGRPGRAADPASRPCGTTHTPGADSRCGSDDALPDASRRIRAASSRPARRTGRRCSAGRAPGRRGVSPPRTPWMRQLDGASEPTSAADSSPRGALCASFLPPSSLWPMLRTSTETTLSAPGFKASGGRSNVALEFWLPLAVPVRTVPRCVPLTHTCHAPARPVPARQRQSRSRCRWR